MASVLFLRVTSQLYDNHSSLVYDLDYDGGNIMSSLTYLVMQSLSV